MKPLILSTLVLIAGVGWAYPRLRVKPPPPPLPAASVESWTGVWASSNALLRLRQTGAALQGEYGLDGTFAPLTGRCYGDSAVLTTRVKGKLWRFRLTREGQSARLTGRLDANAIIDRPRPPVIITPRSQERRDRDREDEQKRIAQECDDVRQAKDFGVFERIE